MFPVLRRFVDQQTWLDSIGEPLQSYINKLYQDAGPAGKQIQNLLNGVWLGHPLHPVLTDVPVGAWTTTFALDTLASVTDNEDLASAADLSLGIGLAAGFGAALTGWTDWKDTYGGERKVGLLHGLMMATTITAYTASLLARLAGARSAGVALANLGYAVMAGGAYMGGEEVFDLGYGVNHTAFQHGPGDYVAVMPEADLPDDTPTQGRAQDVPVLLVKQNGQIFCLDDTCVHAGCSLAGGHLEGQTIVCPCHGSQYQLRTGAVVNGPATMPQPHYEVRVSAGTIEVKQAE